MHENLPIPQIKDSSKSLRQQLPEVLTAEGIELPRHQRKHTPPEGLSYKIEVTGTARSYRAAPVWSAGSDFVPATN